MSSQWYYADRLGQQQGPVDAEHLQSLVSQGALGASSLVWRAGFNEWVPLARLALDLGLDLPGTDAPTAEVAAAPGPARALAAPPRKGSGLLVIAIVVAAVAVPLLGILAAVAIPAYQDYTVRSKVMIALEGMHAVRQRIEDFRHEEDRCPVNGEAGFLAETAYANDFREHLFVGPDDDGRCAIEIGLKPGATGNRDEPARIQMFLGNSGEWQVQANLPARYLPAGLRAEMDD